jgi:hypothetical protein
VNQGPSEIDDIFFALGVFRGLRVDDVQKARGSLNERRAREIEQEINDLDHDVTVARTLIQSPGGRAVFFDSLREARSRSLKMDTAALYIVKRLRSLSNGADGVRLYRPNQSSETPPPFTTVSGPGGEVRETPGTGRQNGGTAGMSQAAQAHLAALELQHKILARQASIERQGGHSDAVYGKQREASAARWAGEQLQHVAGTFGEADRAGMLATLGDIFSARSGGLQPDGASTLFGGRLAFTSVEQFTAERDRLLDELAAIQGETRMFQSGETFASPTGVRLADQFTREAQAHLRVVVKPRESLFRLLDAIATATKDRDAAMTDAGSAPVSGESRHVDEAGENVVRVSIRAEVNPVPTSTDGPTVCHDGVATSRPRRNRSTPEAGFRERYVEEYWKETDRLDHRPSYDEMASIFSISKKSVERYVARLKADGLPYPPSRPEFMGVSTGDR